MWEHVTLFASCINNCIIIEYRLILTTSITIWWPNFLPYIFGCIYPILPSFVRARSGIFPRPQLQQKRRKSFSSFEK